MSRNSRRPNMYLISCLAALLIVVLLAIATLDHRTYIDVNSARVKRQWEAGPVPVPWTREVVETDLSRLVARNRPARDARPPLWKPVASHMAFLPIYPNSRYGGAFVDLNFLPALFPRLDLNDEERNELVARAMSLLRAGELWALHELVRELEEKAIAGGFRQLIP